jgi:hypothetical protein
MWESDVLGFADFGFEPKAPDTEFGTKGGKV